MNAGAKTLIARLGKVGGGQPGSVVLPEMDDPRVAAAAERLSAEGLATPLPIAEPNEALAQIIMSGRGVSEKIAARMLAKPLIRAAAMVAAGEADAFVAGAVAPTRRVIEAAALTIGLADGITTPSSFFVMAFPDGRELIFADCAATVAPDASGLADIAIASARSATALLGEARVALLSYSTGTSGAGPTVDLIAEAATIASERGLSAVGPVQADAALNPAVAAKKGGGAGDANVLIFPSLDAGNIAYKLAQELAGAQAVGPILQGFRRPVCDLSRGATVDDIVAATVLTMALA